MIAHVRYGARSLGRFFSTQRPSRRMSMPFLSEHFADSMTKAVREYCAARRDRT